MIRINYIKNLEIIEKTYSELKSKGSSPSVERFLESIDIGIFNEYFKKYKKYFMYEVESRKYISFTILKHYLFFEERKIKGETVFVIKELHNFCDDFLYLASFCRCKLKNRHYVNLIEVENLRYKINRNFSKNDLSLVCNNNFDIEYDVVYVYKDFMGLKCNRNKHNPVLEELTELTIYGDEKS